MQNLFITNAWAQGAGQENSIFGALMPLVIVFAIFYFLVIRPQKNKQKQHEQKVSELTRGTKIITGGGFYATIQKVHDGKFEVTLDGDNTVATITKGSVIQILSDEAVAKATKSTKSSEGKAEKKSSKKTKQGKKS